jgi:hypothetical protein
MFPPPESVVSPHELDCLLTDKGKPYLAETCVDVQVSARVTSVGFARLRTLPSVHEDLDYPLGLLGGKVPAQECKQLGLIAGNDIEHTGARLRARDISRARRPRAPLMNPGDRANPSRAVQQTLSLLPQRVNCLLLTPPPDLPKHIGEEDAGNEGRERDQDEENQGVH